MPDIVVAGGAGFIGTHLCQELLDRGHKVICVDNLSTGQVRNLKYLVAQYPLFEFVNADVSQAPVIPADFVVHLASPASPVDYDRLPLETLAANSVGTWRLLDTCKDTGARFLFTSTSEVYGDPLVHPQPETYWGNVDPVGPRSAYDEGKRFGEALIVAYRRVHHVNSTIVRLFNTYGPRMRVDDGRVIPELICAALDEQPMPIQGHGEQTRSFCYVKDTVRAILSVLFDPGTDGEIFNIGNPREISIRHLAETIKSLSASPSSIATVPARLGDPQRRRPVIDKVTARYGWRPEVTLEEGLSATIDYFRQVRASGDSHS